MKATVRKWGNSLALRIPKSLADQYHLGDGSTVEVAESGQAFLVKPVKPGKPLKELLEGIRNGNLHGETGTGRSVGREIW